MKAKDSSGKPLAYLPKRQDRQSGLITCEAVSRSMRTARHIFTHGVVVIGGAVVLLVAGCTRTPEWTVRGRIAFRCFTYVALLTVIGCAAQQPAQLSTEPSSTVVGVRVYGHVTNPGWVKLSPPLTITHAVAVAGGIRADDKEHTPFARVLRCDWQTIRVSRALWTEFELQDGDEIHIPKRIFP